MEKTAISAYQKRIGVTIDSLANEISAAATKINEQILVTYRIKDIQTLEKKMALKHTSDIFSIKDVYGIRVIVETVVEAYTVLTKIREMYPGFLKHDYLANPKTIPGDPLLKGKMLRLLQFIASKNDVNFEIQITTKTFHEMNETLHEKYRVRKYGEGL